MTYAFVDTLEVLKVLVLARSSLLVLLGALGNAVLALGVQLESLGAAAVALIGKWLFERAWVGHDDNEVAVVMCGCVWLLCAASNRNKEES
jgi:hypothetical protein